MKSDLKNSTENNYSNDLHDQGELPVKRGKLFTYRLVKNNSRYQKDEFPLLMDCGFGIRRVISDSTSLRFKPGDLVSVYRGDIAFTPKLSFADKSQLFTYVGYLQKVVDNNTLMVLMDCGFGFLVHQWIKLKGVKPLSLATKDGMKARNFVVNKLRQVHFIVVKTTKVTEHESYSADVFYQPDESDSEKVANGGIFLNQQILDECVPPST